MNFVSSIADIPVTPKCNHDIQRLMNIVNDIARIRCEKCYNAWTTFAIQTIRNIGIGNKFGRVELLGKTFKVEEYRCSVCGSEDKVEHNDEMHAQEGIW